MSKPVSNAEIEDVLSSIRRLVSENATAQRRDRTGTENSDRLVLTPAFRVSARADTEAATESPRSEEPDEEVAEDVVPPAESRTDDVDTAVEVLAGRLTEANIIPETSPETAASETAAPEATDSETTSSAQDGPASAENAVAETIARASEDRSLELRIAELEAAVDDTADEWEPDGSEAEDVPDKVIFHRHSAAKPDGTPEPEPAARLADSPEPAEAPDEATMSAPEDTGSAVTRDAEPQPAPETGTGTDDTADWEDVMVSRPDDAHAFGGDDVDDAEVLEEESVIDEAILRDYVAQLVREELQGPIGERITHNVRRMVRREIARAMALRDLD